MHKNYQVHSLEFSSRLRGCSSQQLKSTAEMLDKVNLFFRKMIIINLFSS